MFNGIPVGKLLIQAVGTLGVHKIVNDIVVNNTTVVTTFDAIRVAAGNLVLSSMLMEVASNHIDRRFDEAAAWMEKRKEEEEEKEEEGNK
jgi:hypothetical protein